MILRTYTSEGVIPPIQIGVVPIGLDVAGIRPRLLIMDMKTERINTTARDQNDYCLEKGRSWLAKDYIQKRNFQVKIKSGLQRWIARKCSEILFVKENSERILISGPNVVNTEYVTQQT